MVGISLTWHRADVPQQTSPLARLRHIKKSMWKQDKNGCRLHRSKRSWLNEQTLRQTRRCWDASFTLSYQTFHTLSPKKRTTEQSEALSGSVVRTRACATRKQSKPFESRSLALKFDFTRNKSRHLIRERRCDPDWRVSGSRRHTDRDHTHATSYTGST